jgi:hypothetical protein
VVAPVRELGGLVASRELGDLVASRELGLQGVSARPLAILPGSIGSIAARSRGDTTPRQARATTLDLAVAHAHRFVRLVRRLIESF